MCVCARVCLLWYSSFRDLGLKHIFQPNKPQKDQTTYMRCGWPLVVLHHKKMTILIGVIASDQSRLMMMWIKWLIGNIIVPAFTELYKLFNPFTNIAGPSNTSFSGVLFKVVPLLLLIYWLCTFVKLSGFAFLLRFCSAFTNLLMTEQWLNKREREFCVSV